MLKLNNILTIAVLVIASLGTQSTFADDSTIAENQMMTQTESSLIDWTKKAQTALTSRMEKKLANQLIAKNYNIAVTHLAIVAQPVSYNTKIVLANNEIVSF